MSEKKLKNDWNLPDFDFDWPAPIEKLELKPKLTFWLDKTNAVISEKDGQRVVVMTSKDFRMIFKAKPEEASTNKRPRLGSV